jgi:hypothetical protein
MRPSTGTGRIADPACKSGRASPESWSPSPATTIFPSDWISTSEGFPPVPRAPLSSGGKLVRTSPPLPKVVSRSPELSESRPSRVSSCGQSRGRVRVRDVGRVREKRLVEVSFQGAVVWASLALRSIGKFHISYYYYNLFIRITAECPRNKF